MTEQTTVKRPERKSRPVDKDYMKHTTMEQRLEDDARIIARLQEIRDNNYTNTMETTGHVIYHGDIAYAFAAIAWNVRVVRLHNLGVAGY